MSALPLPRPPAAGSSECGQGPSGFSPRPLAPAELTEPCSTRPPRQAVISLWHGCAQPIPRHKAENERGRGGAWVGLPFPAFQQKTETRKQHLPLQDRNAKCWAFPPEGAGGIRLGAALLTVVSGRVLFTGLAEQIKPQGSCLAPPAGGTWWSTMQGAPWPAHAPSSKGL